MKKSFLKLITAITVITATFMLTGCPYRANGSVIQDVAFNVNYTTAEGEQTIDATLSLYKTFAPETTKTLIKYFKQGKYNGTALTLSREQNYAIIGEYNYVDGEYSLIDDSGFEKIYGEFTNNGFMSRNNLRVGALVMIRDYDTGKGATGKFDTAKFKFAIVLDTTSIEFSKENYCIFGYIDNDGLEDLQTALQENTLNEHDMVKLRYAGDRNDDDVQTYENAEIFYTDASGHYYIDAEGNDVITATDSVYGDFYGKITDVNNSQDIRALPEVVFTVNNFKLK